MGYLERNSETWKTPGFSGFECRVSGIGRVSIFGFGSGSGRKKVGLFPRVSGFRVQRPITTPNHFAPKLSRSYQESRSYAIVPSLPSRVKIEVRN